ncbi:MAG: FtsQ-type POTRA domain-containing protein [Sphaerochaetaceae bacterium]
MSSRYAWDFDYDNYRSNVTPPPRPVRKRPLIFILPLLLLALAWYSLRFIPHFDINQIVLSTESNITQLPIQIKRLGENMVGKSLFSPATRQLRRSLKALSLVKDVQIKRRSFNTLELSLELYKPEVEIVVREEGQFKSLYLLIGTTLSLLEGQKAPLVYTDSLVVNIESSFEQTLLEEGFSPELHKALEIATKLKMEGIDIESLNYSAGGTEGRGSTEFNFKTLNYSIRVYEPISEIRLREALQLIKLERENSGMPNIALAKRFRYDLDGRSLIRRQ